MTTGRINQVAAFSVERAGTRTVRTSSLRALTPFAHNETKEVLGMAFLANMGTYDLP